MASLHRHHGPRRPRSAGLALPAALLAVLLAAQPALAAVTWHAARRATGAGSATWAHAAGRTSTPSGAWLHLVTSSNVVDGAVVTDTGPFRGIDYRRSQGGTDWSKPRRLNAAHEHGDFAALATSGSRVYAVWRAQAHIDDYEDYADATPVRLRVNDDHGKRSAWRKRITLAATERVDRPSIAASGKRVLVAYTQRDGGEIRLLRSTDRGRTWGSAKAVGATVLQPYGPSYGYVGRPVVAGDGDRFAIAWATDSGVLLRRSSDGGRTWGTTFAVTGDVPLAIDLAVDGDRVAVAWMTPTGGWTRVRIPGAWQDPRLFAAFGAGQPFAEPFVEPGGFGGVAVAMSGSSGLSVAWSACTAAACPSDATHGSSVLWRESKTNGQGWKAVKVVGSYLAASSRRVNRAPSIVLAGSRTRHVLWLGSAPNGSHARIWLRTGTGTP